MAVTIDYTGKVVLVTGGTKGVGRGIATRFGELGASVAVCARTPVEGLPDGWLFLPTDVRDPAAVSAMVDAVVERFGRLDVAVNNAGGGPLVETATVSPRFTERIVALNLLAPIYVCQRAYHHMKDQAEGGAIINVGSVVANRPAPAAAAYGAAKAGLQNFTMTVGQEWAPKVRVNSIVCGMVRTEEAQQNYGGAEGLARAEATVPAGRFALPSEIGDACAWLASPLASYVMGANIALHGGGERPPFLDAIGE